MERENVRLEILDKLIHYSVPIYTGLPMLIFVGYFSLGQLGLFRIDAAIGLWTLIALSIPMGLISFILYVLQRNKLKFQFVRASLNAEEFKGLIKDISIEYKWTIRTFKNNTFTIKTNPGFVNQSWGQHITIKLITGGILVNSIFDPNKGSWLITFGSNQKNINDIKRLIATKATGQRVDIMVTNSKPES